MSLPLRGDQHHNTADANTVGTGGAQESKWEEPGSAQSQSSVPSWFRPGSSNEKSQPLLPMPVQGNDATQTPSSLGLRPSQWSIKAIALAAGGLLAAIWLVFAAFRSITGGSVSSLSTMKSTVSLEQSIFNETLGVCMSDVDCQGRALTTMLHSLRRSSSSTCYEDQTKRMHSH